MSWYSAVVMRTVDVGETTVLWTLSRLSYSWKNRKESTIIGIFVITHFISLSNSLDYLRLIHEYQINFEKMKEKQNGEKNENHRVALICCSTKKFRFRDNGKQARSVVVQLFCCVSRRSFFALLSFYSVRKRR